MKKIIPYIHLTIILLAWSSPFWLDWKFILVGYALYFLQNLIFKECVLTTLQFGKGHEGFNAYYLHKLGFKWKTENINFFINYIQPTIIILTALIYQNVI